MTTDKPVTLPMLYDAMATLVRLIDNHGDQFWPLFERLEGEILELESRPDRLAKYRRDKPAEKPNPKPRKNMPAHYQKIVESWK